MWRRMRRHCRTTVGPGKVACDTTWWFRSRLPPRCFPAPCLRPELNRVAANPCSLAFNLRMVAVSGSLSKAHLLKSIVPRTNQGFSFHCVVSSMNSRRTTARSRRSCSMGRQDGSNNPCPGSGQFFRFSPSLESGSVFRLSDRRIRPVWPRCQVSAFFQHEGEPRVCWRIVLRVLLRTDQGT